MEKYRAQFKDVKVTSLSSRISADWKALSDDDREYWRKEAERDKLRYDAEKSAYTGPWKVPFRKRSAKDPSAPRRPPSAFLNYCQLRRKQLSRENPGVKNTEISKMLGQEWKNAPLDVKRPYMEKELIERAEYHRQMDAWKAEHPKQPHKKRRVELPDSQTVDYGHDHNHLLLAELGGLSSTQAMMDDGEVTPNTNPTSHEDVKTESTITPSPSVSREIMGQSHLMAPSLQQQQQEMPPSTEAMNTTIYGNDWRMMASTSMSLRPVPIWTSDNSSVPHELASGTGRATGPSMPSSVPPLLGQSKPLSIAPRKVTLDVDGSSSSSSYNPNMRQAAHGYDFDQKASNDSSSDDFDFLQNQAATALTAMLGRDVTAESPMEAVGTSNATDLGPATNSLVPDTTVAAVQEDRTASSSMERSIIPYRPLDPMVAALGVAPAPSPVDGTSSAEPAGNLGYDDDNDIPILMPYGKDLKVNWLKKMPGRHGFSSRKSLSKCLTLPFFSFFTTSDRSAEDQSAQKATERMMEDNDDDDEIMYFPRFLDGNAGFDTSLN